MSKKKSARTEPNPMKESFGRRFISWLFRSEPAALAVYLTAEDFALLTKETPLSEEEQARIVAGVRRAGAKRSDHLAPRSMGRITVVVFLACVAFAIPFALSLSLNPEGKAMGLILAAITALISLFLMLDRIIVKMNSQNYELATLYIVLFGIASAIMGIIAS